MNSQVCSLCNRVMSEENAQQFAVEIPEIGKRLLFKACVACQEKAKTNTLYICLGCKSISWHPSGDFCDNGVKYQIRAGPRRET